MSDWLQGAIQHYDGLAQQIDGDLLKLENFIREHDLVIDFPWGGEFRLSGVVQVLREGFELLFFQFPDPDLLRKQAHNLADLHGEGQVILKELYASLLDLPAAWQGPSAEAYLGPQLGPMSDTQMEAFDQAHKDAPQSEGWHLHANLASMLAALDHNAQSHHDLAHTFAQVHDTQNEMRFVVPVAVASAVMTPETPPPGDVAEAGIAAAGAAKAGGLVWRLKQLLPIFAVLGSLALVTGIVLVGTGILPLPNDSGAPPRKLKLVDPLEPLRQSERGRLKSLLHEFPDMALELLALIRAGYSDDDIRRIMRNILAAMDRNGINYNRQALLFAVVMPPNDWNQGRIVFLEQGNAQDGWYHILNGTGRRPGHRAQFMQDFGLTSDDQIMWLIMDAVATDTPIAFAPDPVHGGGAYTYVVTANGHTDTITIVVGSNGYIVSAYPSRDSGQ